MSTTSIRNLQTHRRSTVRNSINYLLHGKHTLSCQTFRGTFTRGRYKLRQSPDLVFNFQSRKPSNIIIFFLLALWNSKRDIMASSSRIPADEISPKYREDEPLPVLKDVTQMKMVDEEREQVSSPSAALYPWHPYTKANLQLPTGSNGEVWASHSLISPSCELLLEYPTHSTIPSRSWYESDRKR